MGKPRFIAGVDVGSSKICALAGEVFDGGRLEIIGSHTVRSQGIQRGTIVDLGAAAAGVSQALSGLGMSTKRKIEAVLLATSTPVASLNCRGTASSLERGECLTLEDARQAINAAADADLPGNRQVLHAIPRRFTIDGQTEASNPIGLFGRRLDVEAHLVTAAAPSVQAVIASFERNAVEVAEVIAQPLATAHAVLTREEREGGVAVADMGGGVTSVMVFIDGAPWHTASIPIGGRHFSQDIATVLGLNLDVAEDLKVTSGHALPETVDGNEELTVPFAEAGAPSAISRRLLCQIIEARALELVELIEAEIKKSGYAGLLPGGLVIAGGTAQLPGIARLASAKLQMRVRIGQPETLVAVGLEGTGLCGPAYVGLVGLLLWGIQNPYGRWWRYPANHTMPPLHAGEASTTRFLRAFLAPISNGRRAQQRLSKVR